MTYNQDPTTLQVEILTKLIAEGLSPYEIRRRVGISQSQVERWLKAIQLKPKPPKRNVARELNAREKAEFISYWKTMPSQKNCCAKYQTSVKNLKRWLTELNLAPIPAQARPQKTRKPASDHSWQQERALAQRIQGEEEPRVSIADRFRQQGRATANPYR